MHATVTLEWDFLPANFFEEEVIFSYPDCSVSISSGKVKAIFDANIYDANPAARDALDDELRARFLGANIISPQPFFLNGPILTRIDPEGHRGVEITLEAVTASATGGVFDIVTTDKDGNVISDTRRDRIEGRKLFANRVAERRNDPTLMALVRGRDSAARESDVELVRLFEIADALEERFGKKKVCAALGLNPETWGRFQDLCNDKTIRQARHRGRSIGAHRDATESELAEARTIATEMIERYLDYLEDLEQADS